MGFLEEALGENSLVELNMPHFEPALAIILARNKADGRMRPVGSGFIASAGKDKALIATAAHVVDQVLQYQQPSCRPHRSALQEFLPQLSKIHLHPRDLLLITGTTEGSVRPAKVIGLMAFQNFDVGLLLVTPQNTPSEEFHTRLAMVALPFTLNVGDAIAVFSNVGLTGMDEPAPALNGDLLLRVVRQPVVRVGRVIALHPEGSMVYRGACMETNVPAEAGMSGGPAFVVDEGGVIRVFGVVCSSIADDGGPERAVIAYLPPQREQNFPDGSQSASFYGECKFEFGELTLAALEVARSAQPNATGNPTPSILE